jgi:hypothetical protein
MRDAFLPYGVEPTKIGRQYTDPAEPFGRGLRPEQDHLLTGPLPEDELAAETMNVWFYDGARDTGFNIHASVANGVMTAPVTVFLPDGRILRIRTDEPDRFTDPREPHTKHVRYTCEAPFRKWRMRIDELPVWVTNAEELHRGAITREDPTTTVSLELEAEMMSPVYLQGAMLPEAADLIEGEPGLWFAARVRSGLTPAAFRFDQMYRGTGHIRFEGQIYPFEGFGLRGHVRGVRQLSKMDGHTWLGGAFPSGMTFGIQTFPRPEGGFHFTEGYIYKNGIMYPNRVIYAPRMNYDPDEPEFTLELACDQLGLTRITGSDRRLFWWSMAAWGRNEPPRWGIDPQSAMVMRQAVTRYECDGEIGYGIAERSGWRRGAGLP